MKTRMICKGYCSNLKKWVTGYYWESPLVYGHAASIYVEDAENEEDEDTGWVEVDRESVKQYVLQDVNGEDVFEDDTCRDTANPENIFQIKWGEFRFYSEPEMPRSLYELHTRDRIELIKD